MTDALPASRPARLATLAAVLLALAYFAQAALSSRTHSLTYDEPSFIAAGLSYLQHDDFRMNPEAPPLLQELVALPLWVGGFEVASIDDPAFRSRDHHLLGQRLLADYATRLPDLAFRARLPIMLLGSALVLAIYGFAGRLHGPVPGLVAALVAATCPNLIAHGQLATSDLGCAALMFAAVSSLWWAVRRRTPFAWSVTGLVTGAACLAKFTSLLLGPMLVVIVVAELARRRLRLRDAAVGGAIVLGLTLLVIAAGYNLSFDPRLYLAGLNAVYDNALDGYQFYLLGKVSPLPWWHYHLVAFAMKVPLPLLGLLLLSGIALAREPQRFDTLIYLVVPALVILGVSCFDAANLGLRRVLPAFPFLIAAVASAAASRAPWMRGMSAVLGLWMVVEAARIYPHQLSYFNQAVGGPARGPWLLDDSNLDWGQDLPALAAWQRAHPEARPLQLFYFGSAPPAAYGVDAEPMDPRLLRRPLPGYYAVSAHILAGLRKRVAEHGEEIDWLSRYQPMGRAGYSIYIYQFH